MTSQARTQLTDRLKDVIQLLDANDALTRFKRATQQAQKSSDQLAAVANIVSRLVNPAGRGRRAGVDALNRACIVMLSAHLEGFIEDLFKEASGELLADQLESVEIFQKEAVSRFSNPTPEAIDALFGRMGFEKITQEISWRRATSETIRKRLREYIELRNRIAHGVQAKVTKPKAQAFKEFLELFANNLDSAIAKKIGEITGMTPWDYDEDEDS